MIRLDSIDIENLRGIREGRVEGLTDVNIFVGRNNSGKSTVVEAIIRWGYIFGKANNDPLDRPVSSMLSHNRNQGSGYSNVLWHRQLTRKSIQISVQLSDRETHHAHTDKLAAEIRFVSESEPNVVRNGSPNDLWDLLKTRQFGNRMLLFRPQDGLMNQIEGKFWSNLLSDRRDKYLTAALNELFEMQAESFAFVPPQTLTVLFETFSVPLDSQGDGPRSAIRALIALASIQGTMFLMEEPECFQHPGSLERYGRAVCKLARERETQLVISTHSEECVRAFLNGAKAAGTNAAVFHLNLTDGLLTARKLNPDAVANLESSGVDPRYLDSYG